MNLNLIELLKPYNVFSPKKRLGPKHDGGYVISEIALDKNTYPIKGVDFPNDPLKEELELKFIN
tara:strand:- start:3301 stop:3492 length:192 start_codon:yes stop_codon:yes gene_type:complete